MPNYKAIPTKYNGVQYRSRLEARWALFFDYLGIKYYYEYEGFQLPSGWYLPDFYLPEHGWFEIKPVKPNERDWKRANQLSEYLKMQSEEWLKWLSKPSLKQSNFDPKAQVYILVDFPVKFVFDTTMDIYNGMASKALPVDIFYFTCCWFENHKTNNLVFSRNIYWEKMLGSEGLSELFFAGGTGDKACPSCDYKTGLCKELDDLKMKILKNYESTHLFSSYIETLSKRQNIDNGLRNDCLMFENKLRSIYKTISDEHDLIQSKCSSRHSQRIEDAYQMALKHRFY